ncbi:hypothetical protein [Ferrimonas gelatinilytica]|uniref:Cardiolipin synthase N-terminal domain-containing protein n=1 Tax=Ferrimonas gelatinilytica TaxID=1255257 RepID=A0ABP9RZJ2_9GAMM
MALLTEFWVHFLLISTVMVVGFSAYLANECSEHSWRIILTALLLSFLPPLGFVYIVILVLRADRGAERAQS